MPGGGVEGTLPVYYLERRRASPHHSPLYCPPYRGTYLAGHSTPTLEAPEGAMALPRASTGKIWQLTKEVSSV